MAAFFLADFSVGFFLGAVFAGVLLPELFRAAVFFFPAAVFLPALLRAACFLPRAFEVRAAADFRAAPDWRLSFFFAALAPAAFFAGFRLTAGDFFAAFFFFVALRAVFFAMRASSCRIPDR